MLKIFLILWIIPLTLIASEQYNLRRCVLLPILHESQNSKLEKKIYKEVEKYLREGTWCAYRSSDKMNDILKKYHGNLDKHLSNQEVLRLIAKRENSGSLIRVKVASSEKGTFVEVEVIGSNGRDLLYSNRSYAEDLNLKKVYTPVEQISRRLDEYAKMIPYEGIITRVDKEEFSFNVIKNVAIDDKRDLIVRRPIRKRINPMMPGAIEWELKRVGRAKFVAQKDQQIFAKVEWAELQEKLAVGDWVSIDSLNKEERAKFKRAEIPSLHEYKKRAEFNLVGVVGYGQTTNLFNSSRRQVGGLTFGASTDFKWWMKNHHLGFNANLAYRTGFYSKKFGTLAENTVISQEQHYAYKAFFSYRHFPSEFFYGPHITYSLGFASYNYKMDYVAADGFTTCHFFGPAISIRGSFPIAMNLRVFLRYEMMPFVGQFSESDTAYGDNPESVLSNQFEAGTELVMSRESAMYTSFQWTSNKAKFDGPDQEIHFEDFALRIGFTLYL